MFLEKLEIQGFKSFATKNKLIFPGFIDKNKRGLTAIVGPNGSGKSNIADAIRWVLGEQSLKTLRGKKSEDIIFSGSDQKNKLNLAEVSLYLNNSDRITEKIIKTTTEKLEDKNNKRPENNLNQLLATCEELIITRRLYRSGESEYLLNNNRVRLADIQLLLAKANFGQKTYSVIGQGMVENFLNSSTAERKDFFDEATGVKQFQIKRDSALNKLESSYENLQQVEMLLGEIKPHLRSLTRQVEKLKRRSELEKSLQSNQLDYYRFLWQDINHNLEQSNQKLLAAEKIKQEKEKKLEELNNKLKQIRTNNNTVVIDQLRLDLKKFNEQKNRYQTQLTRIQAELELQLESQGKFDVSWLHNKQAELEEELKNIETEINSLSTKNTAEEEKLLKFELANIDTQLAKINKQKIKIQDLLANKNQDLQEISKLEANLEINLKIQEQLNGANLENKNKELLAELKIINQDLEKLQQTDSPVIRKNDLEHQAQVLQKKLNQLNVEISSINKNLQPADSDDKQQNKIKEIIDNFLDELEQVNQETELTKIKEIIQRLKQTFKSKIETLINKQDNQQLRQIKIIQEKIIELTEKKETLMKLITEEQLQIMRHHEKQRLLTSQKQQINQELTEIKIKLDRKNSGFKPEIIKQQKIKLTENIAKLENEIKELEQQDHSVALNQEKETLQIKLQNLRLKNLSFQEQQRSRQAKREKLRQEINDLRHKLAKSEQQTTSLSEQEEETEIKQKLEILSREIEGLEIKIDKLDQEREAEKIRLFNYQNNIQLFQQEINSIANQYNNSRIESTRQETKLEDLETSIKDDGLSIMTIKNHLLSSTTINLEQLTKIINQAKSQLELIGGIDPEAEKEYQETKKRYDFLKEQTTDLQEAIKSLEELIKELDKNIKVRFDSEFKIIAEKFNEYFKILFNGGRAKILKLSTEDSEQKINVNKLNTNINPENSNSLNASEKTHFATETQEKLKTIKFLKKHNSVDRGGIEIQATPPGKKIQTVTMLSGGERALTAIALICAIISANPSPFVVLDEVDAALDESNSERLAKILDDLSHKTQFVIITHNRAGMRNASILYGITMETDGTSKLLSIKLDKIKK